MGALDAAVRACGGVAKKDPNHRAPELVEGQDVDPSTSSGHRGSRIRAQSSLDSGEPHRYSRHPLMQVRLLLRVGEVLLQPAAPITLIGAGVQGESLPGRPSEKLAGGLDQIIGVTDMQHSGVAAGRQLSASTRSSPATAAPTGTPHSISSRSGISIVR